MPKFSPAMQFSQLILLQGLMQKAFSEEDQCAQKELGLNSLQKALFSFKIQTEKEPTLVILCMH